MAEASRQTAPGESAPQAGEDAYEPDAAPTPVVSGTVAGVLTAWLVAYATIGQRIYVSSGPGEAVSLAALISVFLFAAVLVTNKGARELFTRRMRETPWLLAFVSVWTALGLAGPIVGYPARTMASALTPLSVAALCGMGLILAAQWRDGPRRLYRPLLIIGLVQFVVGALQALWYTRLAMLPPQRWLYLWDTAVSTAYGVEQYAGRSVGLYVNPNPYTLLGAIILLFALTLDLKLLQRLILAAPAVGILLLGASRSALLGVAIVAIPVVVPRLRALEPRRALAVLGGVGAGAAMLVSVSVLSGNVLFSRFAARWASVPDLVAFGAAADANAAGRVGAWGKILAYWIRHPLGTFGPPQMAVSSFTDNDYITLLLQGGVILLAAYIGTLIAAFMNRRHSPLASSVTPLLVLVAITGLTQTSVIMVPALALFWPMLGTTMGAARFQGAKAYNLGPRRAAAAERAHTIQQRRTTAIISGALLLVVIAAVGLRIAGRGFTFPTELPPDYTRPRSSVEATVTLPGWRVDAGDQLGMYYVDLPLSESADRVDDLSSPNVSPDEDARLSAAWKPATAQVHGRSQVVPVAVAIAGLRDYTRSVATDDPRFAESARKAADWLIDEQESDGSWRYRYAVFDLAPGWASANMQSTAISLLTRMYQDTGEDDYLAAAERGYAFMMQPVAEGGTLGAFRDEQPVLQGYANSSVAKDVLSGALVGLFGVHDLAVVTDDPEVRKQFERLSESVTAHLDEYDIEEWSRYSLGIARGPAPHLYHRLYLVELRALNALVGDDRLVQQADRWQASLVDWVESVEVAP